MSKHKYSKNAIDVFQLAKKRTVELGIEAISRSNITLSIIENQRGFAIEALEEVGFPIRLINYNELG